MFVPLWSVEFADRSGTTILMQDHAREYRQNDPTTGAAAPSTFAGEHARRYRNYTIITAAYVSVTALARAYEKLYCLRFALVEKINRLR
jgi:hypothetical protein